MPHSLLSRVFLLIVLLMVLSLLAFSTTLNYFSQQPRAQQQAQLVVSIVNLSRSAILSSAEEWRSILLEDLAKQEDIRIQLADVNDQLKPLASNSTELSKMVSLVRQRLGSDTLFASERNGVAALWVSFTIGKEQFWLALPKERIHYNQSELMFIWIGIILLLALCGAYWVARQISKPLKELAFAAQQIGSGKTPPILKEQGSHEITTVSQTFNQMAQALAQHDKERALVLAGISHDLRTPITRVRLAAEMIDDELIREGLISDVSQMDEIIQQFLDYSRLEQFEANKSVDIQSFIYDLIQQYPNSAQWKIELNCPLTLSIKPLLLKRAIYNLLENAHKYGHPPFKLTLNQQQNDCCISIFDQGTGIPSQQHEQVVRPFIRLDNARTDTKGSGLGLAIVAYIVQQHQGKLVMQQLNPTGFMIQIQLPVEHPSRSQK